jgi:transcriptional regulator GlxA family with amidase domain
MDKNSSLNETIGAVLFSGFELLDLFGPLEAFGKLAEAGKCRIVTVAESEGPVASAQGPLAVADYDFERCPPLEMLLVPGGIGTRREIENQPLLEFIRSRAAKAQIVMSVCTGAGLLARAGVLDEKRATTNKRSFAWPVSQGPRVNWVREARWVEDGKFVTSSGISAGIDMALAVIARRYGNETAQEVALAMEYEWHRDPGWDPFAKVYD